MKIDIWGDSFKNEDVVDIRDDGRTNGIIYDCRGSSFRGMMRTEGIEKNGR